MESVLAIVVGILVTAGVYLILSRDLIRVMLGLSILSNGANLLIFTAGRVTRDAPPIIDAHAKVPEGIIANPLPQALILTAIVIGFSLLAFALVLTFRSYRATGNLDVDGLRFAEPMRGDDRREAGEGDT
jgi:multicomponent Na+:H+ antiporter subunit C